MISKLLCATTASVLLATGAMAAPQGREIIPPKAPVYAGQGDGGLHGAFVPTGSGNFLGVLKFGDNELTAKAETGDDGGTVYSIEFRSGGGGNTYVGENLSEEIQSGPRQK